MIKKLIKYDVIKMTGTLPYFYAFAIFFAGLTRLVNIWSDIQFIFIIGQIFQGTAIALMVNILINTYLSIIVRSFVPSFYKDESYLTHTLPVTKNELMLSKFVSAIIITFLSFIVCFGCLFIMFYSQETMTMLKMLIEGIVVGFDMSAGTFVAIIALVLLFQIIAMMLMGFSAVVKGYSYNNGKVKMSFVWFIIYYAISSVINLIIVLVALAIGGNASALTATVMEADAFITILIVALVDYALISVAFYIISNKLFSRGVNVD